jgi:hypothetical protein
MARGNKAPNRRREFGSPKPAALPAFLEIEGFRGTLSLFDLESGRVVGLTFSESEEEAIRAASYLERPSRFDERGDVGDLPGLVAPRAADEPVGVQEECRALGNVTQAAVILRHLEAAYRLAVPV